ncbi:Delta3-Delta2-enoyl-CoA isomerase [Marchantia polymorpha subsp. ruderalis]|uniref:Delta(3)-Delta(2)-enoyl-CoA isomerase n=2 Tax=Marchantia polymorpha TaxID=3197 RepID=A0AAF6BGR3_MARPO|nr:hypothetical protein MARPO_0048s0081 [Marchantia polymorpha]BBN11197.1 hypothetical protein Mp_5g09900 [Marchantia polymorpha subsp. ruderalis]|eukprot:PTQ38972.1 hypothetical protein MARPO_0048s0081 [Marchantia polymorpha]
MWVVRKEDEGAARSQQQPLVTLQKLGRVYVMTLIGDGEHRLDETLMEKMIAALNAVQLDEDAAALVTTNEGRFYSNGFNLNWIREEQKKAKSSNLFGRLLATLIGMSVPTIAAICGHASAGGLILAMAHDHRFMASDRGFLYMSEMDVQVRISTGILNLLRASMSPKAFKDNILLAKKQKASDAQALGIVDSVHENASATLQAAINFATELTQRNWNRTFYRTMRLDLKPGLLDSLLNVERQHYVTHRSKI